ncbi:QDR1 [Symbiodinium necroappetens]|uniref:QDR1 protein n=1 Tax=Symbiodinium necroappetens TaxID=1628268 RepID=A0A812YBM1_9DINO|nr:QDR1 [Symbiodinium necroappetens]
MLCTAAWLSSLVVNEVWIHRQLLPLALAQMMLVVDQKLLPANMTAVAKEFGFNDAEKDEKLGGVVSMVFFTFGSLFSLLVGCLADIMNRRTIVFWCMLVGSSATFANSQVHSFWALLCCRGVVGAAMGGLIPGIFAVIGDMYSPEVRPHAIGIVAITVSLGSSVGQALAGYLGSEMGWRSPFAVLGALGWGVALLLFINREEPGAQPSLLNPECGAEHSQAAVSRTTRDCRTDTLNWTVLCLCTQGIMGCVPWAVIGAFMPDYLATNAHMGVRGATSVVFSFGVGCTLGTITGGKLGQYLYEKDKRLQGWLMGVTVWGGMLLMFCVFACSEIPRLVFHLLAFFGGFLASMTNPNAKAMLLNVVDTKYRGTIFGVFNITDDVGKALGPALVSSFRRVLGRQGSFLLGITFWLPSGLFCVLTALTVVRDDISSREEAGRERCLRDTNEGS